MADSNETTNTPTVKGMGKQVGDSGTRIYSGIITSEEYNRDLIGKNGLKQYDIMRRSDATVHAALQVCKLPILSAKWDIQPASEDQKDVDIAEFVEHELFNRNVNFHNFLRESLTMFDYGYSVFEKVFELTQFNGQTYVGINSIGYRKQTSILMWQTEDEKLGIQQQLTDKIVSIYMPKLIVFSNDKEGDNYEGISLLRYAYKHWYIKDKLDVVNAVALEKLAVGVPVLKKPADADAGELSRAREALRNMRANEEGYQEIPQGWELEMLDLKANSTKDVIPTIQYHDRQITKSVLAQFLELGGTSASGSRAVSQDHSKLFLLSEEATAKNVASTIQEQLVKQLCDLNFSDLPNGYPKITFSKIGDEDVTVMADAVQKFMSAGALTPGAEIEEAVRETLHLPAMTEDVKNLYEAKNKAAQEGLTNLSNGNGTTTTDKNNTKDTNLPTEKKNDPSKNQEQLKASAIRNAEIARKGLIDILVA